MFTKQGRGGCVIKPKKLNRGDKVAVISLSSGMIGDKAFIHKYTLAKERLENNFGLKVVAMPNALKGSEYLYNHPEKRAEDLLNAFKDNSIKAVFSAIGGDDTIRLLPYIDYGVIKNSPKIFMGFSDTTVNHFMMFKAGLVSFYGPAVMSDFAEYVKMNEYTENAVKSMLFQENTRYELKPSPVWSKDFIFWDEKNKDKANTYIPDYKGYEVLQGQGIATGQLLGGCLDVFVMCMGTEIWPALDQWRGKILFLETSEDKPNPDYVKWLLRGLQAQGILQVISGVIVGKPQGEAYYSEYKTVLKQVFTQEVKRPDLPVFYNVNFGHAMPIGILPYGINTQLDCKNKTITLLESGVVD